MKFLNAHTDSPQIPTYRRHKRQITLRFALMLFSISLLVGCGTGGDNATAPPLPPTTPDLPPAYSPVSTAFTHALPEDVGLDSAQLATAFTMAESQTSIKSLLVLKDNHLIAEQYFNQSSSASLLHLRSVTKTIVALITGIALEEQIIPSIDLTIGEFLIDEYPWLSEEKANIQIKHLLTMSSGFEWSENAEYETWANSADPIAYLLEKPLSHTPGTRFVYNTAAVHLLAKVLLTASQGDIIDIAIEKLFTPLGITSFQWDRLKDDLFNGGSGLQLRPIDQAKIGQLLLNRGIYTKANGDSTVILPESWMTQMFTSKVSMSSMFGPLELSGYSYLTWRGTDNDRSFYFAWGWGGQFIVTFPEENMVVIANNEWQVTAQTAAEQEQATLAIILDAIMPALLDD